MTDAAVVTTASLGAPAGGQHYVLRLYGYSERIPVAENGWLQRCGLFRYRRAATYAVGLINPYASPKDAQKIYHFIQYQPHDDVEYLLVASWNALHNLTGGILNPWACGEVADETTSEKDLRRFKWVTDFPITAAGYKGAQDFIENTARRWSYNVRNRNCVTFSHAVARAAGVPLTRPFVQRPQCFMERIRGDIRQGRVRALAAKLPAGRRYGPLPAALGLAEPQLGF